MFDIGFWELVLIFVVALVVLGPERMPSAIRSVGRFVRTARQMANSVKDELNRELELSQLQQDLKNAEQTMKKKAAQFESSIDEAADSVKKETGQKETSHDSDSEGSPTASTAEKKPES